MIRLIALLSVLALSSSADAQCSAGRCPLPQRSPELRVGSVVYFQYPAQPAAVIVQPRPVVYASPQSRGPASTILYVPLQSSTDPYGFVLWLNAYRGARGRPPISYNAYLSALAATNSSMGFGHHGPGGFPYGYPNVRRENVGGDAPASVIWPMWTTSPAHNDALLDPTIRSVGIAYVNGVWTMNGR